MMKQKIILIGSAFPFRGGLAAYNERLAEEFSRQGHEVEIYNFTLQYPGIFFPGKTQYADWDAPENLKINSTISSVNPLSWIKTGREIRKKNPDLVIIKYWMPFFAPCFGTILRIIRRNRNTRIISIIDNLIPHERRPGDRVLTSYFIKPVDGFVSMSSTVSKDIRKVTRKPMAFCPHPLFDTFGVLGDKDQAKKKLGLSTQYNYLLFFGLVRKYKGLDILLEAVGRKDIKAMPLRLVVAGEFYESKEPYLEIVRKNGLEDRVTILDRFIPNQEVADYFNMTDLVVLPYKSATQSGVTQIALHFEKPMIVTNVGGLSEIVPPGKAGYVIEPSADAIADAIVDFFQRKEPGYFNRGIRELKKEYSWDRMVRTIFSLSNQNEEYTDDHQK